MPQWYDVNYAYSGLHSIINPPPPNVDLFEEEDVDVAALVAARIKATALQEQQSNSHLLVQQLPIECNFCHTNYQKTTCQFYPPLKPDFKVMIFRNGNPVVCECCDFSEEEAQEESEQQQQQQLPGDTEDTCQTMQESKNDADVPSNETTNDEAATEEQTPSKVQPGWYGKGWRVKSNKRKRRRNT